MTQQSRSWAYKQPMLGANTEPVWCVFVFTWNLDMSPHWWQKRLLLLCNGLFTAKLPIPGFSWRRRWSTIHLPPQDTRVQSLGQEDALEKGMASHSLPEKSHGLRSILGCSPRRHQVRYDWATNTILPVCKAARTAVSYRNPLGWNENFFLWDLKQLWSKRVSSSYQNLHVNVCSAVTTLNMVMWVKNKCVGFPQSYNSWDFAFQCRGRGFNPWSGS